MALTPLVNVGTIPDDLTGDPIRNAFIKYNTHTHPFGDLSDVDLTTTPPVPGDVLEFDGINWIPGSGIEEVVSPVVVGDVGTVAPTGADLGIDPATGDLFYVDGGGLWQAAPTGGALSGPPTVIVASVDARAEVRAFVAATGSYGFLCDGVADDVEINAALALLGATTPGTGRLILTEGDYDITAPINATAPVVIEGSGRAATILNLEIAGAQAFGIQMGAQSLLSDLQINDNALGNFTGAVLSLNGFDSHVTNVRIVQDTLQTTGHVVQIVGDRAHITNSAIVGGGAGAAGSGIFVAAAGSFSYISGNEISNIRQYGIFVDGSGANGAGYLKIDSNHLTNVSMEGAGLYDGIHVANPGTGTDLPSVTDNVIVTTTGPGHRDGVRFDGANVTNGVLCANQSVGGTGITENDLGTTTIVCGAGGGPGGPFAAQADALLIPSDGSTDLIAAQALQPNAFLCDGVDDNVAFDAALAYLAAFGNGAGRMVVAAGNVGLSGAGLTPKNTSLVVASVDILGSGIEGTYLWFDTAGAATAHALRMAQSSRLADLTIVANTRSYTDGAVSILGGNLSTTSKAERVSVAADASRQFHVFGGGAALRDLEATGGGAASANPNLFVDSTADSVTIDNFWGSAAGTHGIEVHENATNIHVSDARIQNPSTTTPGASDGVHFRGSGIAFGHSAIGCRIYSPVVGGFRDGVRFDGVGITDSIMCANTATNAAGVTHNNLGGAGTEICVANATGTGGGGTEEVERGTVAADIGTSAGTFDLGYDPATGDLFYSDAGTLWAAFVAGAPEIDDTVTTADIGTAAGVGFKWGVDPATGDGFYVDGAGDWQAFPVAAEEVERGTVVADIGTAAGTFDLGYDPATGDLFYSDGGSLWAQFVAGAGSPEIDDTVTTADIGTAAGVGFKWGVDPLTGDAFYVDGAGDWQQLATGGGGGSGGSYIYVDHLDITSPTALVQFTQAVWNADGIAAEDLVLVADARTDRAAGSDGFVLQVGSGAVDAGANYMWQAEDQGTSVASVGADAATGMLSNTGAPFTAATADASAFGHAEIFIGAVPATNHQEMTWIGSRMALNGNRREAQGGARWKNTTPIDVIEISPQVGTNFVAGSRFTLYKRVRVAPSGGGATACLLGETIAAGGEATLQVSGIPAGHEDLIVVFEARSDAGGAFDTFEMRVGNGTPDTGANYDWFTTFTGASTGSANAAAQTQWTEGWGATPAAASDAGAFQQGEIRLAQYDDFSRNRYMSGHWQTPRSGAAVYHGSWNGRWINVADAIDVVEIGLGTGNFAAGSRIRVFAVDGCGGGGGGAVGNDCLLGEDVPGVAQATLDVNGMGADGKDLTVLMQLRSDNAAQFDSALIRFNGDAAANYFIQNEYDGSGTGNAQVGALTDIRLGGVVAGATAAATEYGIAEMTVYNYADLTQRYKRVAVTTWVRRNGSYFVDQTWGWWDSGVVPTAIAQITVTPLTGTQWDVESYMRVYQLNCGGGTGGGGGGGGAEEVERGTVIADIGTSAGTFDLGYDPATGDQFYRDAVGNWAAAAGGIAADDHIMLYSDMTSLLGTGVGEAEIPIPDAWTSAEIRGVSARVRNAPSGADIIIDLLVNGVTTFPTATKATIVDGTNQTTVDAVPDNTALVGGDYMGIEVEQVGSVGPGSKLVVAVRVERTA